MIVKNYLYKCPKCKKHQNFDETEKFSTKCPRCKIEMNFIDAIEYDNSKKLIKPSEPTVDHYKLKAELEGRTAIKCIYCGSYNTKKISTTSKVAHTAVFGLFSMSRNSKQWHCNKCGSDF